MNNDKLKAALKAYTEASAIGWRGQRQEAAARREIDAAIAEEQRWWTAQLRRLEKAAGGRWQFRRGPSAKYAQYSGLYFSINHAVRPMTGRVMCKADLHAPHQHGPDISIHATAPWEDRERLLDDLRRIMGINTKGK